MTDPDQSKGLYEKYDVRRLNDPDGKHNNCYYFVLDLVHDKFALPALSAYALACQHEYPELSIELAQMVKVLFGNVNMTESVRSIVEEE